MLRLRFAWIVLIVGMSATLAAVTSRGTIPAVDKTEVDASSSKEFASQVAAILQAYRKHDAAKGRQLIEQFRLPNAEAWFAAHLNPARSAEFASRYDRLYADFAGSFELTVQDIAAAKGAEMGTKVKTADEKPAEDLIHGGKRSGVVTTNPVDLYFCMFQITVKKSPNVSWGSTFVEQDGAFRFVGNGGWPFWVWQDHTEGGGGKGSHFGTPPILISRAEPVYPVQAKAMGIEGTVLLRILIDKEGRVEKVDVLGGEPTLVQAAIDAVRQWRYKPATIGGADVPIDQTATVVFSLHRR